MGFVRDHPRATGLVAFAAVALAVFGALWFQPWKLVVDRTVDEALPGSIVRTPGDDPTAEPDDGPSVLSSGMFRSLEHDTTGTAKLIEQADGTLLLRFEDLDTSNGPDLVVILSQTPATEDDWYAYDDDPYLVVAPLKGNRGSQNYALPANVDLTRYRSVAIWCRRFTVSFAAAPLEV